MKYFRQNSTRRAVFLTLIISAIFIDVFIYKNNQPKTFQISITDQGFSLETIDIPVGSTVVWTNNGKKLHWPASNFHPTHSLYPDTGGCIGSKFDACRGLKNGESFSFKFDHPGMWSVHDHLFPGLTMTVEVYSKSIFPNSFKNKLQDKELPLEQFLSLEYGEQSELIKYLARKNPKEAWDYLKKTFFVNGQAVGNVHEFAHIIGNKSYERDGLEGVKICDQTFAFGCFHGVTEALLLKDGPESLVKVEKFCLDFFSKRSENYTGCIHGSGHGLYGFEGGDIKKALADCEYISDSYKQYCYDGVFMENSVSLDKEKFDYGNPWKICTDLDPKYHYNCARYQYQILLERQEPIESLGKNCSKAPNTVLKSVCYEGLGYHVAQFSMGNIDKILEGCGKIKEQEGVDICMIGSAKETTFQRYIGFEVISSEICKTKIDGSKKSQCLKEVELIDKAYVKKN